MKSKGIKWVGFIGFLLILAMVSSFSFSATPFISSTYAAGGGGGGGSGEAASGGLKIENFNMIRLSAADTFLQFDFSNGLDRKLDDNLQKIHVYIKENNTGIQFTGHNYIKDIEGDATGKLRRLELLFDNLLPGTGYVVEFAADFEANNGNTLGKVLSYEFTTDEGATAEEPVEEEPGKSADLTDIKGHWAESNIVTLVALEVVSGYPDDTFKPDNNISRAEFATALVKAFQLVEKDGSNFTDTAGHWAENFIATAAAHGIITGYSAALFGPDDNITREQMAVMIAKAAQLPPVAVGSAFNDSGKIAAWAQQAVATVCEGQVMTGYPDGTFRPQGPATRAEAATALVKALE